MSSIIPGYEYDIFISYRQKDNKRDKWVTEFVNSLKNEIEATFKGDISVYFDENPHDGLLETHDVDDSLAKKLKCLIFIPIISKTYCDPNSFAWTKEFLVFNQLANNDEYGIKINLPNGNTASRVLPVKIHQIDDSDRELVEKEIGFLRSIDFVYQSPGVNRPLNPKDNPDKNLNETLYRDQINKVANAIQEIIAGVKNTGTKIVEKEEYKPTPTSALPSEEKKPKIKSKTIIAAAGLLMIIALVYFFYTYQTNNEITVGSDYRSIAVLAFDDQSPDGNQEWLGDGLADEILNVLAQSEGLKVSGKTSSFLLQDKGATIKEIGEALGVKTVLEGSVSKVGDKIRITAQLIDVESEAHIWSDKYDRGAVDIFAVVDEVSQNIVGSLISELSGETLKNIKMVYQPNPQAYEYFLKAEDIHAEILITWDDAHFQEAKEFYQKAIEIDSEYMDAFAGFANLYDTRGHQIRTWWEQDFSKRDSILNIAYQTDPESPYVLYLKGFVNENMDSSLNILRQAHALDPYYKGSRLLLDKLRRFGFYDLVISLSKQHLIRDPLNKNYQKSLVQSLMLTGQLEEAREVINRSLDFDNDYPLMVWCLLNLKIQVDHDLVGAKKLIDRLIQIDDKVIFSLDTLNSYVADLFPFELDSSHLYLEAEAVILALQGKKEEALTLINDNRDYFYPTGASNEVPFSLITYDDTFWVLLGKEKEEEYLKRVEERIEYRINHTDFDAYLDLKGGIEYRVIRQEPKFQQWLNEAKAVHEERVKKYYHFFDIE